MHRRTLLGGAALFTAAAGCLGNIAGGSTEITDVDFETGVDVGRSPPDDPIVDFADDEVRVTGSYWTGNACYDEHLEDPSYSDETDELHVRVTRVHDGSDECDDLEESVSYRVIVQIEGELPGTVRAREDMGGETIAERDSGLISP
ncbi:hypothetical protein [Halovivax gelatinilyticus]|uniref:hypothetical protein n=1 Tax=Halovivax gelatinilyticus TaxID=2961597 RepID=UPI0020CA6A3B|nr:hypothetical protein [Halovivax gelatinilyticus]